MKTLHGCFVALPSFVLYRIWQALTTRNAFCSPRRCIVRYIMWRGAIWENSSYCIRKYL